LGGRLACRAWRHVGQWATCGMNICAPGRGTRRHRDFNCRSSPEPAARARRRSPRTVSGNSSGRWSKNSTPLVLHQAIAYALSLKLLKSNHPSSSISRVRPGSKYKRAQLLRSVTASSGNHVRTFGILHAIKALSPCRACRYQPCRRANATTGRNYMSILAPSRTLRPSMSFLLDGAPVDGTKPLGCCRGGELRPG